jgi:hypothetical protein
MRQHHAELLAANTGRNQEGPLPSIQPDPEPAQNPVPQDASVRSSGPLKQRLADKYNHSQFPVAIPGQNFAIKQGFGRSDAADLDSGQLLSARVGHLDHTHIWLDGAIGKTDLKGLL